MGAKRSEMPTRNVTSRRVIDEANYEEALDCGHRQIHPRSECCRAFRQCPECRPDSASSPLPMRYGLPARKAMKMQKTKKPPRSAPLRPCLCGCGALGRGLFRPGHDSKTKARLVRGEPVPVAAVDYAREHWGWVPAPKEPAA